MDEKTREALNKLILAVKAFTGSVEKSFHVGMIEGTADMVVQQYNCLHSKAHQLLPDNFYINELLVLEPAKETIRNEQAISRVMLISEQLLDYLQNEVNNEPSFATQGE